MSAAQTPTAVPAPAAAPAGAPRANTTTPAPGATEPSATAPSVEDRSQAFRAVQAGGEMQSGEALLVEAYAAIWIILFAMIFFSWRRQRAIDERVRALEGAIARARAEATRGGGAAGGG